MIIIRARYTISYSYLGLRAGQGSEDKIEIPHAIGVNT